MKPLVIAQNGPGIIGAYGTGPTPVIQAWADLALIELSSRSTPGIGGWRIMDLELSGAGFPGAMAVSAKGGMDQVTLLRLAMHDVHNGVLFSYEILDYWNAHGHPGHKLWDQIAIVDCTSSRITGVKAALSVYASATRLALLGNAFDNSGGGEHTVRLPSVVLGVVANNSLRGQGKAAGGKHAFTLRAAAHGAPGVEGGRDTQYVEVSDNKFVGADGSDWTVMYGPQAFADERVVDVVTERNWFVAGGGAAGTQVALTIFGREQTIRNNLFDATGGKAHGAVVISDGLSVGSNQVRLYNNSFYSADRGGDFVPIEARAGVTNVTAGNNLASGPGGPSARLINDASGRLAAGYNVGVHQPGGGSGRPAPLAQPENWRALAGGRSGGSRVPVWSDFFLVPREKPGLGAIQP